MILEIQTIEGRRLEWIGIFSSTKDEDVIDYGHALLSGFTGHRSVLRPALRVVNRKGEVLGAWQTEGYESLPAPRLRNFLAAAPGIEL